MASIGLTVGGAAGAVIGTAIAKPW